MFARYFVEVEADPAAVESALLRDPEAWLPGLAARANGKGDELLAEIGFGEKIRVRRRVRVKLGDPVRAATKSVVPCDGPRPAPRVSSPSWTPTWRSLRWRRAGVSSR